MCYDKMDFTYKCRTCLEFRDDKTFVNIMEHCFLGKSYKDAVVVLVPGTIKTLNNLDRICENCADILKRSMKFIQHCLAIESIIESSGKSIDKVGAKETSPNEKSNLENNANEHNKTNTENNDEVICISDVDLDDNSLNSQDVVEDTNNSIIELHNDLETTNNEHDYSTAHELGSSGKSVFDNIQDNNRILSVESISPIATEKILSCLNDDAITIFNITSDQENNSNGKKRLLLIGSCIPVTCNVCSKPLKHGIFHSCKNIEVPTVEAKKPLYEKCPKCDRDIRSGYLPVHLGKHDRERERKKELEKRKEARRLARLVCGTCSEKFSSKEEYIFHLEIHPPYVCEQCGKGFVKKESLYAHRSTHNDPNSYLCEVCGKGFKESTTLRCHLHTHETGTFKCSLCPKVFNNKNRVKRHMKQVHQKIYNTQCTECGKLFMNKTACNSHVRLVHFKEKPYECHICFKRFGRMDYLKRHRTYHTKEYKDSHKVQPDRTNRRGKYFRYKIQDNNSGPVACKHCGKYFSELMRLKRHLETHFKRYPCQFCPLTFSRKAFCHRHEKIHEGGKVNFFRCNVCWKRLPTKELLDIHLTSHDKPRYFCELCGKTFNRRFLMNHHKLMEHEVVHDDLEAEKLIFDSLVEATGGDGILELFDHNVNFDNAELNVNKGEEALPDLN